ncbi:rCG39760 [Rattus norvegicus]|uniref:RCG39760 n=1 Tax=Rattus norvegicus TaxID=10116 RepID=A6I874_RAT|nr:rCG39760 [Rattus norvegicus]
MSCPTLRDRKREFLLSLLPPTILKLCLSSPPLLFPLCLFKMSVTGSSVPVFHGSGPSLSLRRLSFPEHTNHSGIVPFPVLVYLILQDIEHLIINYLLHKYIVQNVGSACRANFRHYWSLS